MTLSNLNTNKLMPQRQFPIAVVNEGSTTVATYTDLTNPDSDGYNYRSARWTASGVFVVDTSGFADALIVGGGASGGAGGSGIAGGGGGGGAVIRLKNIWFPAGSYTVTIGAASSGGSGAGNFSYLTASVFSQFISGFKALGGGGGGGGQGSGGASGDPSGGSLVLANSQGSGAGTQSGGMGGGGGGAGGNASGTSGGSGLSVSGWTTSPTSFGAGGSSTSSPQSKTANTGNGGDGWVSGTFTTGASGVIYIRWRTN